MKRSIGLFLGDNRLGLGRPLLPSHYQDIVAGPARAGIDAVSHGDSIQQPVAGGDTSDLASAGSIALQEGNLRQEPVGFASGMWKIIPS
jgi:hypothetical protein